MKDEQWWKILSAIEKEKDLNRDNVIEKIKEELKAEDKNWYKKWEKAGFGVNYLFEVESNVFIQCEDGSLILFKDFEDEDFEDNAFTQPKDNGLTLLYLESRPAELPHQSLAELYGNLSVYTAPII